MRTKHNRKIARNSSVNNDKQDEKQIFEIECITGIWHTVYSMKEPWRHGMDLLAKKVKQKRI